MFSVYQEIQNIMRSSCSISFEIVLWKLSEHQTYERTSCIITVRHLTASCCCPSCFLMHIPHQYLDPGNMHTGTLKDWAIFVEVPFTDIVPFLFVCLYKRCLLSRNLLSWWVCPCVDLKLRTAYINNLWIWVGLKWTVYTNDKLW